MGTRTPGWHKSQHYPYDWQWWDGKAWQEAYWPHSRPDIPYLPEAVRWDISTSGEPSFDIAGEVWHGDDIASVIGRRPPRDVEVEHYATAELVPEPDNPHDPNALCVRINGKIVGYLPAGGAPELVELVQALVRSNIVPTVRARIWAVTRFVRSRNREELKSAIRLALPDSASVLPVNAPPSQDHAVIPAGRSIQVTGEGDHYQVLAPYIGKKGGLIVTLHPIELLKARSSSTVLEVRVDGRRAGQLTPATSASLMPLVAEATRKGMATAAWATLTGSKLAAELTLKVAKAEQIPDSWPSANDRVPTLRSGGKVPPAYIPSDPLTEPPAPAGLSVLIWVVTIITALVLMTSIPIVGVILGIALLVGALVISQKVKKRPPRTANNRPSFSP